MNHLMLRDMAEEERPRERLLNHGAEALSNSELLALILRTGSPQENVIDLSKRILSSNTLQEISRASAPQLMQLQGIGLAKSCQLVATFELARRVLTKQEPKKQITAAKDIANACMPHLSTLTQEHFIVFFLDIKNHIIKKETLFIGTLDVSIIHPRDIFKKAYEYSAANIIAVHNHPSGDPTPSAEDIQITGQLIECGKLLGVNVLDHVIIGKNNFYSLKENNQLD